MSQLSLFIFVDVVVWKTIERLLGFSGARNLRIRFERPNLRALSHLGVLFHFQTGTMVDLAD